MHIITTSLSNFTFIDKVPAGWKPVADPGDTSHPDENGIKVTAGSGGTLRVEAADDETFIEVPDSSATYTTVRVTDGSSNVGNSKAGSGISDIENRTNDVDATGYHSFTGNSPSGDGTYVIVPKLYGSIDVLVDTGDATYATVTLGQNETVHNAAVKTGAGYDIVNVQESDGDDGTDAIVDFGAGTGTGDGLGLHNVLNVHGAGLATIAHVGGGSGTIVIDEVNVYAGASLVIDETSTIGDLEITSGGSATLSADGTFVPTIGIGGGGSASIEAESEIGELNVAGTIDFTGNSDPSTIETLNLSGTVNANAGANIAVTGSLTCPAFTSGTVNAVDDSA
jgi:hypothetical protein